ncbi:hypothetical protein ACKLNR_012672 [Fusarium oxysporum f. sp. zingiberi]
MRVPLRQSSRYIAIAPQSDAQVRQVARRFEIIQTSGIYVSLCATQIAWDLIKRKLDFGKPPGVTKWDTEVAPQIWLHDDDICTVCHFKPLVAKTVNVSPCSSSPEWLDTEILTSAANQGTFLGLPSSPLITTHSWKLHRAVPHRRLIECQTLKSMLKYAVTRGSYYAVLRQGTQAEHTIRLISAEIRGFGSSVCINKPAFAS